MGLSVVIAGGIIMLTFLIVFVMAPNTLLKLSTSLSGTMSDISDVEDTISKTYIKIRSVTAQQLQPSVDFTITNNGTSKLWDYENFDVIITYDGFNLSQIETEKLTYDGLCGASVTVGTWCIDQFVNDDIDPQILNANEGIQIKSKLQKNIDNNPNKVIVIVTTNNGVTATSAILASP